MVCYPGKARRGNANQRKMPSLRQSNKKLNELSQRHLKFAELLAEGNNTKADCMRLAGFSDDGARHPDYIGKTREKSKYPALWDYFQELRNRRLRLFDISAESISAELKILAFSKITDFVDIPSRDDLQKQAIFDAKIRRSMGYSDAEDDALLAQENAFRQKLSRSKAERKLDQYAPGKTVKLKCLDDIPPELIPAIASLEETRDGIKIKLWNKLDALDKLARIAKLYDDPAAPGDKPTTIENLTVLVNGSKSDLLKDLLKI